MPLGIYQHGGTPKWIGAWSWEDYKRAGPLLVPLDHRGPGMDGKPLRAFLSDGTVTLAGGANTWVKAR